CVFSLICYNGNVKLQETVNSGLAMSLGVRGLWSLKLATKVLPLAVILLQVFNFGFGSNKTVHVNYSSGHFSVSQLPDDLDVTISVQNSTWAVLHLRRVPHITLDIPMYTLGVDDSGKPVQTKVDLEEKTIVGYYQDLTREAVIQITRTNDIKETSAQYKIEGVLEVAGLRHSILPDDHPRYRRDLTSANSTSEEDLYILEVVDQPSTGTLSDYLDPPPNIEVSKREDSLRSALGSAQGPSTTLSPSDITRLEGEATSTLSETSSKSSRQRREAPLDIFLEIVAVTDFAVYNRYLTAAKGDKNQALSDLRMWYAFVFNGIDLRYQGIHSSEYNINVRLVKLILSETAADAPFTEPFKTPGSHWDTLSAPSALEGIAEFAKKHDLLRSDHVMLMTGYDLTTAGSTTTTGLAYTATLCAGNEMQFSVVEDLGGYQTVETAAHELGHGLGARHDGDGNSCPSTDRYIMAGSSYAVTDSNRLNPWRFSQCSIQAMTSHIKTNLAKPNGKRCLIQSEAIVSSLPDVSQYLPGEVYSPDQQCRNQYGNESRYCRGTEFGNVSTICTSMFCYDPVTGSKGICFEEKAAQGTTCGSEKQCIDGACVYVPNSPQVDETCAYGDQPGIAFNGKTCRQFVSGHPGYCYQTVVRTRCCASCQDFYRPFK
ncbi:A disintegrin and metalloproteinase with thrombospondin motifs 5, partial [Biomphalaria glabrata]